MSMKKRGIALLMVVIIISAASLLMVLGSAMLGIGAADGSYTNAKGGEAFALAEGCMEDALERLRIDIAYAGGNLTPATGSCTITVSGTGMNRTIIVLGTVKSYNKKIQSTVVLSPSNRSLTLVSWQELTN